VPTGRSRVAGRWPHQQRLNSISESIIIMGIAYATTNEVNYAVALPLSEECGAVIHELLPMDAPPDGQIDAVLYDLDDVPQPQRREVLARLLSGPSACPKAVHGYDLSEEQTSALRLRGIAASRHLEPELFRSLRRAVDRHEVPIPPDDHQDDDTWSMPAK
jgi:hypothetical protein